METVGALPTLSELMTEDDVEAADVVLLLLLLLFDLTEVDEGKSAKRFSILYLAELGVTLVVLVIGADVVGK